MEVREKAQKLRAQGLSTYKIAAELGINQTQAYRFTKHVQLPKQGKQSQNLDSFEADVAEGEKLETPKSHGESKTVDELINEAIQSAGEVLRDPKATESQKARARGQIFDYRKNRKAGAAETVETLDFSKLTDEEFATMKALVEKCRT